MRALEQRIERGQVAGAPGLASRPTDDPHDHEDLPILLAGAPTAGLAGGTYRRFPPRTPLANLFSAIALDATGQRAELGDATGTLG